MRVAIPLEQGRFFNDETQDILRQELVAIPLEQGRFFNRNNRRYPRLCGGRNPFGAGTVFQYNFRTAINCSFSVAIPLEQGRFFNASFSNRCSVAAVAIPLEQGRFFNLHCNQGEYS